MYVLDIKPEADKIFRKLSKRDKDTLNIINKKIDKILKNQEHVYKFLKNPLQKFNRIHIKKHFVLVFKIDHIDKVVTIFYYGHHDEVYDWRPNVV